MELIVPRIYGVGTHHKTGTVWMRTVFRKLARRLGVPNRITYPGRGLAHVPEAGRTFLFQWSSAFPPELLDRPDARILHVIRDPRDILISGMRYHLRAPEGGEGAVHAPRDELGGLSYQQHLAALPDDAARLSFEMGERHAETVCQMLAWDYDRPNTIEVRYEDLMADTECRLFREVLRDMGLPEPEVAVGTRLFRENALFGGLADPAARDARSALHVTSGEVGRWRMELPPSVARRYADEYGEALVALGYEMHPTAWLEELCHAA